MVFKRRIIDKYIKDKTIVHIVIRENRGNTDVILNCIVLADDGIDLLIFEISNSNHIDMTDKEVISEAIKKGAGLESIIPRESIIKIWRKNI